MSNFNPTFIPTHKIKESPEISVFPIPKFGTTFTVVWPSNYSWVVSFLYTPPGGKTRRYRLATYPRPDINVREAKFKGMRMRRTLLTVILVISTSLCGTLGIASESKCERIAIPVHTSRIISKVIKVTGIWMTTNAEGILEVDISIRNSGEQSVSQVIAIVNYFDEAGSPLFSIPFQANLPSELEHEQLRNLRPFSVLRLNEPLRPGEKITLTGKNLLSITRIPASAEMVYWLVRFSDNSSSYSTALDQKGQHGFRTDPLLTETPGAYFQLSFPHPSEGVETLLKLRINEYGRVLDVQPGQKQAIPFNQDQFQALSKELLRWHFFPAIENGYAVPSELYLLVDLLPEKPLPIRHCFLEHPDRYPQKFAFVTLEPLSDSTDWIPFYGGVPAGGKLDQNIIKISAGSQETVR